MVNNSTGTKKRRKAGEAMSEQGTTGNTGIRTAESLLEDIKRLAKAGQFVEAEQARRELIELFPMELNAIIRSAEFVEEQMSLKIDQDHVARWAALYDQLTQEEKNHLFHCLRKVTVPKGKLIIRQAKLESRLLFIESGRVTLFHTKGKERTLLGQISRGDILGDETFFALSTPTFSAGSQSDVEICYLTKEQTRGWEESHPGLFAKLATYCQTNSRAAELIKANRFEKRIHQRRAAEGRVRITVRSAGALRDFNFSVGSLVDLSQGGAGFDLRCSQPENARMLLGRELELTLQNKDDQKAGSAVLAGVVVRVGDLHYNDFILHVRFKSKLTDQEFESLCRFLAKR